MRKASGDEEARGAIEQPSPPKIGKKRAARLKVLDLDGTAQLPLFVCCSGWVGGCGEFGKVSSQSPQK